MDDVQKHNNCINLKEPAKSPTYEPNEYYGALNQNCLFKADSLMSVTLHNTLKFIHHVI
jgi:hypothetical protein